MPVDESYLTCPAGTTSSAFDCDSVREHDLTEPSIYWTVASSRRTGIESGSVALHHGFSSRLNTVARENGTARNHVFLSSTNSRHPGKPNHTLTNRAKLRLLGRLAVKLPDCNRMPVLLYLADRRRRFERLTLADEDVAGCVMLRFARRLSSVRFSPVTCGRYKTCRMS